MGIDSDRIDYVYKKLSKPNGSIYLFIYVSKMNLDNSQFI